MQVERSEVGRRPYLDGLRGVAACMVFFDHLTLALLPSLITFAPNEAHFAAERPIAMLPIGWIWNGSFAVCIFFVLSGYVLSEFCSRARIGLAAQIARRYVRLALPMVLTSALAFAIMALGLYKNLDAGLQVTKSGWLIMWYRAFVPNLLDVIKESLLDAFINGSAHYNSNLWTMKIELVGSICVFLIFFIFKSPSRRAGAALTLAIITFRSYYLLFALGVIYYFMEARIRANIARVSLLPWLKETLALVLCITGLYLGAFPATPPDVIPTWHWFLPRGVSATDWHMVGAALLVAGVLFCSIAQSGLGGRFGAYLGRISFVLYLVHLPLICSFASWSVVGMSGLPYAVNIVVTAFLTGALVFGTSTILYLYVDIYTTSLSRLAGRLVDQWVVGVCVHFPRRELGSRVRTQ
ncbi:acyltransferase family protein [Tardiphaga sp. 619_E2_N8_5]|uniref:acyltransferase family protein n=1 Tax=unclassified Tardiphaga TaxID=2631404 RepID=UPI003F20DF57